MQKKFTVKALSGMELQLFQRTLLIMAEGVVVDYEPRRPRVEVKLMKEDVSEAKLDESLDRYTVHELKWWLLCRGVHVPFLWKQHIRERYFNENQLTQLVEFSSYLALCCSSRH